jgi:TPR repeat protein
MYKDGKGIPADNNSALKYYELSANHGMLNSPFFLFDNSFAGFGKALINLGCVYRDGDGVPKNYEKAVKYASLFLRLLCLFIFLSVRCYQQAANQNYPPGLCHLAYMSEFGYGMKRDAKRAQELVSSSVFFFFLIRST